MGVHAHGVLEQGLTMAVWPPAGNIMCVWWAASKGPAFAEAVLLPVSDLGPKCVLGRGLKIFGGHLSIMDCSNRPMGWGNI